MQSNRASNQTKSRKPPQKNRKVASNVIEDVESDEALDDEEEDLRTDARSYPRPKKSQVVLDEEQGSESRSEEDEEDEGRVGGQANSATTTTRPPLVPRNRRSEDEHETRQDDLQAKNRKLCEALRDSQTEVAQLKQRGKEKHKRLGDEENGDQNKLSKKQKTKIKDADDRETHARDLGKRFALEYVLWVDARIVFAAGLDPDGQGTENNEGDNDDAGDNDEALVTQGVCVPLAEPATGWALKTPEGIDQYTRFQVRKFERTLEPKDLCNWGRKWFKKEFCEGARKFRSDILKGLATRPIEVFGLKDVTAVKFMDKNGRSELPEVQELLRSDNFLLGDNPGLMTERIYRNECIVRILLRIYSGPEAVITGVRSRMAHKTYRSKFKPTTIMFIQLALAAVVAKVILEGDAEFTDASADRVDWYWKRLDFLYQIKSKKPHYIDPTIKYLNKSLGFGVEEEAGEELNELEQAMLAELED